jgi:hypothetical protein
MPFIEAFIALVPDADPARDRTVLKTGLYTLHVVFAPDEAEAAGVGRSLVSDEGVQSISLCPGFTNAGVARVAEAVGEAIAVAVSRGDPTAAELTHRGLEQAGWF